MARSGDVFSEKAGITREYAPFRGEVLVIGGGGGGGGAVDTCYHERVVVLRSSEEYRKFHHTFAGLHVKEVVATSRAETNRAY